MTEPTEMASKRAAEAAADPEPQVQPEPRDMQRDQPADAAADPEPEVRPEVIQDLDVTGDEAGDVVGGCSRTRIPVAQQ
jgi:hypothetical protein